MKLVAQMGRKGGFAGSFTDVTGLIVYQTLVFLTNWSLSLKYIYACYIYIFALMVFGSIITKTREIYVKILIHALYIDK